MIAFAVSLNLYATASAPYLKITYRSSTVAPAAAPASSAASSTLAITWSSFDPTSLQLAVKNNPKAGILKTICYSNI